MKKIVLIIVLLFSFVSLFACEIPTSPAIIEAPDITIDDNVLKFNKIVGSNYYKVFIDDVSYKIFSNTYELNLAPGVYEIYVRAYDENDAESNKSNVITYEVFDHPVELDSPIISLNNRLLSWDKINNAGSYDIYVNNEFLANSNLCSYEIPNYVNGTIYVVAKCLSNRYSNSLPSNSVEINNTVSSSDIRILEINDTHGAVITTDTESGLDKVATLISTLESKNGPYIKVANGDIFQGGYVSNVTKGKVFIDALNVLDFDCYVIGNHEFDWDFSYLEKYKDGDPSNGEANFPFLGANIVYADTYQRPSFLDEYTIVESNGLRVGIIGVIQDNLSGSILSTNISNIRFNDTIKCVTRLSKTLRVDEECDLVVVSVHGYDENDLTEMASLKGDERIDAIITGHTHQKISEYYHRYDGYSIPVVQSNTKNISVGEIKISYADGPYNASITHYYPGDYQSSSTLDDIFDKYDNYIQESLVPICVLKSFMGRDVIGKTLCEAMSQYENVDYAIINTGGVRTSLYKGQIYLGDIYNVYPFDNEIIICTFTGEQLKKLMNYNSDSFYTNGLDTSKLNATTTYKVALIDFVYTDTYYYSRYFYNLPYEETHDIARDCLIWYFKNIYK